MEFINKAILRISTFVEIGGPVVFILLIASVIALAIILIKIATLIQSRVGRTGVLDILLSRIDSGDIEDVQLENLKGLMPKIARRSWFLRQQYKNKTEHLSDARERSIIDAEHELSYLNWGNRTLDLIAQTAPLLGLFGTVLGMIGAFRALQDAGSVVDPSVLAGGIWVALMTTAAGLAVAMPVSIALSYFEACSEKAARRAEHIIEVIFRPDVTETSHHET